MTMNVFCRHGDWPARLDLLRDGIARLQPDLIALQEIVVDAQGDEAREILGDRYDVVHSRRRSSDGMGIALASRWPLRDVEEPELPVSAQTGDFPSTALMAEAETSLGPVLLVNHFPDYQPANELERERQAVTVAHAIETRVANRPVHVVLAGDMDAEPDAASLRFFRGRQSLDGMSVCYRSAWEVAHRGQWEATFTERNALMSEATDGWPFQVIDHLLVRCGEEGWPTLRTVRCDLVGNVPLGETWASDHFGLVADLALARE
jgi:endonuclease/exonuclease/phosphatase family metal-dependent hydrolase